MEQAIDFGAPRAVKLTVEDFAILHRAGALDMHRRAELIDGGITEMSPMGTRHAMAMTGFIVRLHTCLSHLSNGLITIASPTVTIPPHDAPEPDIVVATAEDLDAEYVDQSRVKLAIEISASTLQHDLKLKHALYARAGIGEYWVVDLSGRQVHLFWSPADGTYAETRIVPLAGDLRSATIPDLAIDGSGIL